MKKIIKNSVFAFLTIILWTGCDDAGFLEETPESFYTVENVLSTSQQVDQILVTCYNAVRTMNNLYNESQWAWVYKGGNGTDMYDIPTIRTSNRFNDYSLLNAETTAYYNIYTKFYELISYANFAVYAAELDDITWDDEDDKTYALAQARFFRAYAYLNLGELFGGVPIVDEITTEPRYDYERTTRAETYQYAIDELEDIVDDLPETTDTAGRIVRGAAQHYLCQLYIDLGVALEEDGSSSEASTAYNNAVSYADDVIDGGTYSLMTERFGTRSDEGPVFYYASSTSDQTEDHLYSSAGYDIEGNVFWDLFQEGNQNYEDGNMESIWTVQIDFDAYVAEDGTNRLCFSRVYGPVFRDVMSTHAAGMMEDVGGKGVAYVIPTWLTRDLLWEDDYETDLRNTDATLRRLFLGNVETSEYYGTEIPWSVLRNDDSSLSASQDAVRTQVFPLSCKAFSDNYPAVDVGDDRRDLYRDEYLIRLSDTYLLRAEAKYRLGNSSGAAEDINVVRSRAQASYMVTSSDVDIDLILDERGREFMYEEHRWNTLLRVGGTYAHDRIIKYAYWSSYPESTMPDDFCLFPIPQTVIDTNKDVVMEQNPGW